jgi:hypothetical protein
VVDVQADVLVGEVSWQSLMAAGSMVGRFGGDMVWWVHMEFTWDGVVVHTYLGVDGNRCI